jgi:GTP-binding protein
VRGGTLPGEHSVLFIGPGVQVYEGMIIGYSPKNEDMRVNVCKKKHVSNMRSTASDEALRLQSPRVFSLEECLEFLKDDEKLEVTPKNLRMRKSILDHQQRVKFFNKLKTEETDE